MSNILGSKMFWNSFLEGSYLHGQRTTQIQNRDQYTLFGIYRRTEGQYKVKAW